MDICEETSNAAEHDDIMQLMLERDAKLLELERLRERLRAAVQQQAICEMAVEAGS